MRSFRTVGFFAAVLFAVSACMQQPAPYVNYRYVGYGNGTSWQWDMNGNTGFLATESNSAAQIAGSFARNVAGFIRMALSTSTGTNAPDKSGVLAGLEIPGALLFTAPVMTNETQLTTMLQTGNCPTDNFTANYVYTGFNTSDDLTSTTRDYSGTLAWDNSASKITLADQHSIAGNYGAAASVTTQFTGTCTNGTMAYTGGKAYLTNAGTALMKTVGGATGEDLLIAIPKTTITDQRTLGGGYNGFYYDAAEPTLKFRVVQGNLNPATSELIYYSVSPNNYLDKDNSIPTQTLNFDSYDSPSTGFMKAHLSVGGTNKFICAATTDYFHSGVTIIVCTGQSPLNNTKPANLVLFSH